MKNPFIREIRTWIDIEASAEDVWSILVDFDAYPQWTDLFRFPVGHTDTGERLEVRIWSGRSKYMTFRPLLLVAREPEEFRWKGRLLFRGLFDGEHMFRIDETSEIAVRFEHAEIFTGFLVPWLWRDLDTNTRAGFERFNRDLKARAEKRARHAD